MTFLAQYVCTSTRNLTLWFHCCHFTYTTEDLTAKKKVNKAKPMKIKNRQNYYVLKYVKKQVYIQYNYEKILCKKMQILQMFEAEGKQVNKK